MRTRPPSWRYGLGAEPGAGKGESVEFALDGRIYQIDLSAKNASALHAHRAAVREGFDTLAALPGDR
jgi:hypothetical protein